MKLGGALLIVVASCGGGQWAQSGGASEPEPPAPSNVAPPAATSAPAPAPAPPARATSSTSTSQDPCGAYVNEMKLLAPPDWTVRGWVYYDRVSRTTDAVPTEPVTSADISLYQSMDLSCQGWVKWERNDGVTGTCPMMVFESATAREAWLAKYGDLGWSAERTEDGRASWACSAAMGTAITPAMNAVGKKHVALAR